MLTILNQLLFYLFYICLQVYKSVFNGIVFYAILRNWKMTQKLVSIFWVGKKYGIKKQTNHVSNYKIVIILN